MKKILAFVVVLFGISSVVKAADNLKAVEDYTQNLIDKAIVGIFNKNIKTTAERVVPFRKAVNENFDFEYIAKFVLGPYGRNITDAQLAAFVKEFEELNIYSFVKKFGMYSDLDVKVDSVVQAKKEGQFFVESKVKGVDAGDKDYLISWRIVKEGEVYKVIDVIVEGVSMAMSYKNEYSTLLKNANDDGGVPVVVLTEQLKEMVSKLKAAK